MLYPKEERSSRSLWFACRNCDHQEEADKMCVYRNNVISPLMYIRTSIHLGMLRERTHAVAGLSADPTLPRTNRKPCPRCGHPEAVFFQSHDRRRETPMTLHFVCCEPSCGNLWTDDSAMSSKRS